MQLMKRSPKPRLSPVFQALEELGPKHLYRFVDGGNFKTVVKTGTDRTEPERQFKWYDEERVADEHGLKKNQFTFAYTLRGMRNFIKRSAKFDSGIYTGGFLILAYDNSKMQKFARTTYRFLADPIDCLVAIIQVESRYR